MKTEGVGRYIKKNLVLGVAKTVVTLFLSAVALPLVIQKIGISNYGLISIVLVFSSITGLMDFGLSDALISLKSSDVDFNKKKSAIYVINLSIVGFLMLSGIIVYISDINFFKSITDQSHEVLRLTSACSLLMLGFSVLSTMLRARLESRFKLQFVNIGYMIDSVFTNCIWLLMAFLNSPIEYFVIVPIVSISIVCIINTFIIKPDLKSLSFPARRYFISVLKSSFSFFKVGVLNSLHLPLFKYSVIFFLGDTWSIGVFELSTKLSLIVNNLLSYFSTPFFSIAAKTDRTELPALLKIVSKTTKIILLLSVVGFICFQLLEEHIIRYFFKEYKNEILYILSLILAGYLFHAASETFQRFSMGTGNIGTVIRVKFGVLILSSVGILLLFAANNLTIVTLAIVFCVGLATGSIFWLFNLYRRTAGLNLLN
jgi:O-antigen/teichoic acid export membrane protein